MEKQKSVQLVQGVAQENKPSAEVKKVPGSKSEPAVKDTPVKSEPQGVTQREAVYTEVMRIIRDEKIVIADKQAVKPLLNENHVKRICTDLVTGFQAKKIPLKETDGNTKKLADTKLLDLYCQGLLNNWLRRDPRLNGSTDKK